MRDLLRWGIPGLVVVGPLHLFVSGWETLDWPIWVLVALPIGLVLAQAVRWRFEARGNGYRSAKRPALTVIIERGGLAARPDAGDVAYQVYETVFYQRPDWGHARDHAHRCWDWIFLFQSTALGCALGTALSLLAFAAGPHRFLAVLLLVALPAAALVLLEKARQTEAALHLFDRALVLANWESYEAVLRAMRAGESSGQAAAGD